MKINNLSFPYPVLGIGDDILPRPYLDPVPQVSKTKDYFVFDIRIDMRNSDIYKLIKEGKAIYACEIECPYTKLRECHKSQYNRFKIEIPQQKVGKEITFQLSIVCIDYIKAYKNANAHEDYDDFSIDLEPGDLLAYIDDFVYDIEINYAQVQSIGSFMQITENKFDECTHFNLEGDKIDIKLPTELYENYKYGILGDKILKDIMHSSIVFNALVAALLYYNNEGGEMKLWERTIKYRIETETELNQFSETLETKDINDILALSQALLLNPYKRLFKVLPTLTQKTEEED